MFFVDMKHSIAGIMNCLHNLTSINNWILLLYAGVLSCGVAYTLQIVGQKCLHPNSASLLMSMESVFSVLAGWIILGQTMSAREIFGCIFIFGGNCACTNTNEKENYGVDNSSYV